MYLRTAISSRSSLSRHGALQSGCISVAPAVLFDLAEPQASVYAAAPRVPHIGVRCFQGTRASLKEWVFREAPACHLPFQPSGRPNAPFSPCGLKGGGFRAISGIGTGHRYAWLRCHLFWARAPGATTSGPNNALAPAPSAGADLPPAGAG